MTAEVVTVADDPIERDRWGRPLIIQPGTGELVAYTRASSVGKAIEDTYYLSLWQQRQVLRGVHANSTLLLDVDQIGPEPDRGDAEAFKAWKQALDEIVQRAHEAIGSHDRADLGTAMHGVFEAAALGRDLPPIPDGCDRDLIAWRQATDGWRWLALERFVVNDEFQVAGTLDALILREVDGQMVVQVGDFKTGRSLDHNGLGYTAQVATYTDSVLYDPHTGDRAPLVSLVAELGIDPATVRLNTDEALLVHAPAGEGVCDIHTVPLEKGRAAVAMAMDVRAMRTASKRWLKKVAHHEAPATERPKAKPAGKGGPSPMAAVPNVTTPADRVGDLITATTSLDELLNLRDREMAPVDFGNGRVGVPWTDEHEVLAEAHAAVLQAMVPPVDPVLAEIEDAADLPALTAVWERHQGAWTAEHDAAAAKRAEALTAPPY